MKTTRSTLVPFFRQKTDYTCGPACIRMVLAASGKHISEQPLAKLAHADKVKGTETRDLRRVLQGQNMQVRLTRKLMRDELVKLLNDHRLVIINYRMPVEEVGHYALAIGVTKEGIILHDPSRGPKFTLSWNEFLPRWYGYKSPYKHQGRGIVIALGQENKKA